jgi:hypothetical protein
MAEHKRIGGGLAYPLLTFNKKMQEAEIETQTQWVNYILETDLEFTLKHPRLSMFDYFVGVPNKMILNDSVLLEKFEQIENERESNCVLNKGIYYPETLLQHLYTEMEDLKCYNAHLQHDLHKTYTNPVSLLQKVFLTVELKKKLKALIDK